MKVCRECSGCREQTLSVLALALTEQLLEMPEVNESELGYLIYFFEKACAVSGYLLGVNPFNQPGVESYKKNMFALLGKPGYEDAKAALEAKIG